MFMAALYLRQSLDRTGEMLAISRQRPPCVALCEARGWPYREYVDNDKSATRGRRPAYEEMIADVEAGRIQAIVSLDLDRLYRKPKELEHLIDLADKDGLILATITGDADLSTDNGRLFARIKAAVAKAEMERKAARQKLMHDQRAAAGIPWGNRRTFGYTPAREPHPFEAGLVRDAYIVLLAGGSLRSIAAGWTAAGVTTSLGNEWDGPKVSQMLRNAAYAGLRARNGEIVGPGSWEALIDQETWEAAQAKLTDPSRNPRPGSRARKYLLTGIAECGRCERARLGSGKSSAKVVQYVCRACHKNSRNQRALDDHIIGLVVARLSAPDARELLVDRRRTDFETLRKEAAVLRGRMDVLAVQFAEGDITKSQLQAGTEHLRTKLGKLDAQMSDSGKARIFRSVIEADDPGAAFASESLSRQRAIVANLMRVIVMPTRKGARFNPEAIKVEWLS